MEEKNTTTDTEKDSEKSILNFFTQKPFIITVIVIVVLISLYPTFTKVLERMHFSSTYNTMQKIALAQTNYEITNNSYADDFKELDIKLKDKNGRYFTGDTANLKYFTLLLAQRGILAINKKGDYFGYYDYKNSSFSCAPREHYICKNINSVTKDICEEANMLWSVRNQSCYTKAKDMCLSLNLPWNSDGETSFCGYKNLPNMRIYEGSSCIATIPSGCQSSKVYDGAICTGKAPFACLQSSLQGGNCVPQTDTACHSVQINKGSVCLVNEDYTGLYGCQNATINNGGICLATGNNSQACNKPTINNGGICRGYAAKSCQNATVLSGGICEANATTVCQEITVKKGGRCISNVPQTCEGVYEEGACCHGDYCPADAPKCNCPNFAKVC